MTNGAIENDFLVDLLTLQQDGKQSISAPSNWISQVPLLEVSTKIDEIVKDIGNVMLAEGNSESVARWHFFIGSPGNGKSAAIGKLCRYLHKERECSIVDENNNDIVDLDPLLVPYALYVYEKDINYASALIVQDASVVRKPFSPDVDPATDLIETLQQAWSKGVSLIVCTNRGVIEKAYRDISTNNKLNKAPWFKILRSIAESDLMVNKELIEEMNFEDNKTAFKKVNITCSHLDNMSLLIGSDIFNNLIQKAVDPERWICCEECSVKELCPYKTNQEWLFDEDGRNSFLKILQRAEVYSGQIIVFREAVAIISLILAGCPKDYINGHPCEWVRTSANEGEYFLLATRRIYMTLFSSYAPYGLEQSQVLQKKQVNSFEWLCQEMPGSQTKVKNSLNPIIYGSPLSTDVGVTRLLGEEGIIAQIDPVRDSLPYEFYNLWDSEYDYIIGHANPMLTDIELQCLKIWASLEQSIEYFSGYIVSDVHWALRRWSSNYLMHFGALYEGRTAWSKELDQYRELLEVVVKPQAERSLGDKKLIRDLNEQLEALFNTANSISQELHSLQLSETVYLSGKWVKEKLKPKIVSSEQPEGLALLIEFEDKEKASLSAPMFLWLSRRAQKNLHSQCFPSGLLAGVIDARIRAAAKSKYAFDNEDVELKIITGKGDRFTLSRIDGEVEVQHDRRCL